MSISDHRPWRGIAAVIHHKRHGEHEVTVEVRDAAVAEPSIREWLALPAAQADTIELPRVAPATGPDDVQGIGRMPFTVHRELDDDERFAASMLSMERETQAVADFLAADFDTRMERLLNRSREFGEYWARCKTAQVLQRRRGRVAPLVRELGQLLASEDVAPETAVAIVSLRSRYLSSPEDSQRIPRMTPALLAELDAQKARVAS